MLNISFPSVSLAFWYVLGRATEGAEFLNGFPWAQMLLHFLCWEKCALCDPRWEGESIRNTVHGFIQILLVSFPLAIQ